MPYLVCPIMVLSQCEATPDIRFEQDGNGVFVFTLARTLSPANFSFYRYQCPSSLT